MTLLLHTMSYIAQLNHQLRPLPSTTYRVLDLFAGCGGLSLGFETAGFHSVGCEIDERD
jgi:DNA (cytosine-5)-methyltransferase 1